jgi:hypothetical protein
VCPVPLRHFAAGISRDQQGCSPAPPPASGLPAARRSAARPVYGLIFLFKWVEGSKNASKPLYVDDPQVFFMNQVEEAL